LRPTARILLADPEDRVLLFSASDDRRGRWWFTPGGGLKRGETVVAGAVRELFEETGFSFSEAALGPVVATSVSHWVSRESGTRYLGAHSYFFLRVPHPRIDSAHQEEYERTFITGHHWWTVAELGAATELIWPPGLDGLLSRLLSGDIPSPLVRLPQHG
jgi:8-oxo-dGTP pyrophosphatase MutT (NUDIX family)